MIRTVVFDFGQVVAFFDHMIALRKLAPHATVPPEEAYRRVYGGELETLYETGRISTAEFVARVRELTGLRCETDVFVDCFADVFTPNPEVCDLVPRLKPACRLLLASNTNDAHFAHFRRQFEGVLRHFDKLVVSHEAGARKPHREFFAHCQRFADCEPNECLFVDDLADNVAGAEAFGWQGLVYRRGEGLEGRLRERGIMVAAVGC